MPQAPMNAAQARVVNPVLSTVALSFARQDLISHHLFPTIDIGQRGGNVIKFNNNAFKLYSSRRAPGTKRKRIQVGYAADPIGLVQESLEAVVADEIREEAQTAQIPGDDLGIIAVEDVMSGLLLGLEHEAAQLARNAISYESSHKTALSSTDLWTNEGSDPAAIIDNYANEIRRSVGARPTVLMLPHDVYMAVSRHPKVLDHFKYTEGGTVTMAQLANYFKVPKIVIGEAISIDENAADDAVPSDVWGNDVILAYVPQNGRHLRAPSYGYTYRLRGHPNVRAPYRDNSTDCWAYPVNYERRPYMTGMNAGALIQNVI